METIFTLPIYKQYVKNEEGDGQDREADGS